MSAHSPGPWKWTTGGMGEFTRLRSSAGHTVARAAATPSAADAAVIAAAPEMLALLLEMADPHDCPCHFCDRSRPLTSGDHREGCRLDALLARIKGRT